MTSAAGIGDSGADTMPACRSITTRAVRGSSVVTDIGEVAFHSGEPGRDKPGRGEMG